jgi:RNA-directed DNA polymerase
MPSNGEHVTTSLQRIANRARQSPDESFNNLLHVLTKEFLADCFHALRKDAAVGVDKVTAHEYANGLDDRLLDLTARIHRMGYHPQPVRRVYIPKDKKSFRPLGIPALEDKLVQEGMRRILEAIYEDEFLVWLSSQAQLPHGAAGSGNHARQTSGALCDRRGHQRLL